MTTLQAGMKYSGTGTLAVAWTGPCPHSKPENRVMPDSDAPEWVLRAVRGDVVNQDNGISAGLDAGESFLIDGRPACRYPAWVPGDLVPDKCECRFGRDCQVIGPGRVVAVIRVEIRPHRKPAFPLPKVRNFPGYGLAVSGPETTSSERGVRADYTIEVLAAGEYAPKEWVENGRKWKD